jgi:hypothetical protein
LIYTGKESLKRKIWDKYEIKIWGQIKMEEVWERKLYIYKFETLYWQIYLGEVILYLYNTK